MAFNQDTSDWKRRSGVKGLQMFAADVVGNVTEVVFLKYQQPFDKAVPFLKSGFKAAMYLPVKMVQAPVEWFIDKFAGSIEGDEGREARHHQTAEQRLDGLLESSYHYAAALTVGWGSLVATEKGLSHLMKTKALPGPMWTRVDLPVHLLTAAFLGSQTMKPITGSMKDFTKKLMVTSGWTEEKAEQDSRFAIAYILPNYMTLIPTVGMMSSFYKAESKGILKEVPKKDWFGHPEHHFELTGKQAKPGELGGPTEAMLKLAKALGVIDGPGKAKHA